ncbi:MAG: hypothetical protein ABIG39_04345 [Candidatus Micrarchaeota archaeon]
MILEVDRKPGKAKTLFYRMGALGFCKFQRAQLLLDGLSELSTGKRLGNLKAAASLIEKNLLRMIRIPKKSEQACGNAKKLSDIYSQIIDIYEKQGDFENMIAFLQKKTYPHLLLAESLERTNRGCSALKERRELIRAIQRIAELFGLISERHRKNDPGFAISLLDEKSVSHRSAAKELKQINDLEGAVKELISAAESHVQQIGIRLESNELFGFKHEYLRIAMAYKDAAELCLHLARKLERDEEFANAHRAYVKTASIFKLQSDFLGKADAGSNGLHQYAKLGIRAQENMGASLRKAEEMDGKR